MPSKSWPRCGKITSAGIRRPVLTANWPHGCCNWLWMWTLGLASKSTLCEPTIDAWQLDNKQTPGKLLAKPLLRRTDVGGFANTGTKSLCRDKEIARERERDSGCSSFACCAGQWCFIYCNILAITWCQGFVKLDQTKHRTRYCWPKELTSFRALLPECLAQNGWLADVMRITNPNPNYIELYMLLYILYHIYIYTHKNPKLKHCKFNNAGHYVTEICMQSCSTLRLRAQISSYLDVAALCAERTTSKQSSSWKASLLGCGFGVFESFGGGRGFCCSARAAYSTWDVTRSDRRLRKCSVPVKNSLWVRSKSVVRPDVLMAAADIYTNPEKEEKMAECEQALARDSFQVFAGFKGATMLDSVGQTSPIEAKRRHAY